MIYCKFCQTGLTSAPPETAESKCCNCFRIQGLQFDLVHAFVEQTISQNLPLRTPVRAVFRVLTATASRRLFTSAFV